MNSAFVAGFSLFLSLCLRHIYLGIDRSWTEMTLWLSKESIYRWKWIFIFSIDEVIWRQFVSVDTTDNDLFTLHVIRPILRARQRQWWRQKKEKEKEIEVSWTRQRRRKRKCIDLMSSDLCFLNILGQTSRHHGRAGQSSFFSFVCHPNRKKLQVESIIASRWMVIVSVLTLLVNGQR